MDENHAGTERAVNFDIVLFVTRGGGIADSGWRRFDVSRLERLIAIVNAVENDHCSSREYSRDKSNQQNLACGKFVHKTSSLSKILNLGKRWLTSVLGCSQNWRRCE